MTDPLREALERLVPVAESLYEDFTEHHDDAVPGSMWKAITQARAALAGVGVPQEDRERLAAKVMPGTSGFDFAAAPALRDQDEAHLRLLNDWEAARKIIVGLVDAFDARWTGTKKPPPIYYRANEWLERAIPGGFPSAAPPALDVERDEVVLLMGAVSQAIKRQSETLTPDDPVIRNLRRLHNKLVAAYAAAAGEPSVSSEADGQEGK